MNVTAAEITDSRLDVIGYARDVLERAREETGDHPPVRVSLARDALKGALRSWEKAGSEKEKNEHVRMCGLLSLQFVRIIADVYGWDAAEFVSRGAEDNEEGDKEA